jgi:hypothetical protein
MGVLYDWQTLIAGLLAIAAAVIAAVIGARAGYRVNNAQLAAAKQKDRVQARCLAVAIFPELLQLQLSPKRATEVINQEFPKIKVIGVETTEKILP